MITSLQHGLENQEEVSPMPYNNFQNLRHCIVSYHSMLIPCQTLITGTTKTLWVIICHFVFCRTDRLVAPVLLFKENNHYTEQILQSSIQCHTRVKLFAGFYWVSCFFFWSPWKSKKINKNYLKCFFSFWAQSLLKSSLLWLCAGFTGKLLKKFFAGVGTVHENNFTDFTSEQTLTIEGDSTLKNVCRLCNGMRVMLKIWFGTIVKLFKRLTCNWRFSRVWSLYETSLSETLLTAYSSKLNSVNRVETKIKALALRLKPDNLAHAQLIVFYCRCL